MMKSFTLLSLGLIILSAGSARAEQPAVQLAESVPCTYALIGNYSDADYEAQVKNYVNQEMSKIACLPSDGRTSPKYTLEFDFNVSKAGYAMISNFTSLAGVHMHEELSYTAKTKDRKKVAKELMNHVDPLVQNAEAREGKRRLRAYDLE